MCDASEGAPPSRVEIPNRIVELERSHQFLMERHLFQLLDVHFVASEHPINAKREGQIDTLLIDRHGAPLMIEYNRTRSDWAREQTGRRARLSHFVLRVRTVPSVNIAARITEICVAIEGDHVHRSQEPEARVLGGTFVVRDDYVGENYALS